MMSPSRCVQLKSHLHWEASDLDLQSSSTSRKHQPAAASHVCFAIVTQSSHTWISVTSDAQAIPALCHHNVTAQHGPPPGRVILVKINLEAERCNTFKLEK